MAGLAGLRERAAMWIAMAIGALAERDAGVACLFVWTRCVAFFARHLDVHSSQWVARLRVIELLRADRLPVGRIVALRTVVAKASLVGILVATDTRLREAEERVV